MKGLELLKATMLLRLFGIMKIPLLAWVRPSVVQMDEHTTILKVPLSRRTKNHLNVMYFGALAMGSEAAVALRAFEEIRKSRKRVDFIFKDFGAKFLKRAEGDVHFVCEEGEGVRDLVQLAIKTGERQTRTFRSFARVPDKDPNEIVAEFKVTLSVKART